jgi:tRNA/rRNA methyltransferase
VPNERGPVRGLARLLRRNPTEAERTFWDALMRDKRFIGQGFKRQVPVGPHVTDIVSFPLKAVMELIPVEEAETGASARAERRAWLTERGYRVIDVEMAGVESDIGAVLDSVAAAIDTVA